MEAEVRPIRPEDWNVIQRIYQDGIDTSIATFQPEVTPFAEWDRAHHPFCRLAAVVFGRVAGFAVLLPVSARAVYAGVAEVSIYIAKEYTCQGVGAVRHLDAPVRNFSRECGKYPAAREVRIPAGWIPGEDRL